MKYLYSTILTILFASMFSSAQLVAGDIAIIGVNEDGGPTSGREHSFSWVALVDIPASQVIYFTEQGWNLNAAGTANGFWMGTTEGHYSWTAPATIVPAGTIVHIYESSGTNSLVAIGSGTMSGILSGTGWNLTAGDQVIAYTSSAGVKPAGVVPTFLGGVHLDDGRSSSIGHDASTGWSALSLGASSSSGSASHVPPGLTNGVNALSFFSPTNTEEDNIKYTGLASDANRDTWLSRIYTRANWSINNDTPFNIDPTGYIASGIYPVTVPVPCLDVTSVVPEDLTPTSLTVSWTENNTPAATNWEVIALPTGSAAPIPGTVNAMTNPFTISSLMPDTAYDVYVRTDCATGFVSLLNVSTFVSSCNGGLLTDSGGPTGNYVDNENVTYTICPDNPGDKVVISFLDFSFESFGSTGCFDGLTIYDGDVATGTIIPPTMGGTIWCWDRESLMPEGTGDLQGVSIAATSATGCITIVLTSDGSVQRAGFIATASCESTVYMWDGAAWSNAPEGAITVNDNLYVSGAGAVLSAAVAAEDLFMNPGSSLDASAGDVNISGNVFNNGSITGSNKVVLDGAVAQNVVGEGSLTNLDLDNAAGVTIFQEQNLLGTLDVTDGVVTANGNLTFVSNAAGTAVIGQVAAGAVVGDVNVERFIPAGNRAFRFIGPTVSGPSVFDSWQEAGVNAAGFGVQITGTAGTVGTVNATTGHDETVSGNASMFKWDNAAQNWETVTNTTTEVLTAGEYYRLFVRGDRTTDLGATITPAQTATTLRATGALTTGNAISASNGTAGSFFAFANPYQSKMTTASAFIIGTTADMYYWDPSLGVNGGYSAIDILTGVGSAGVATNVLDPGQAVFFVANSSSAFAAVSETDKVSGTTNGGVFSANTLQQALRLKIYQTSRFNNGQSESDGLYLDFDAAHNLNVDFNDAVKFNGLNVNMAIAKSSGQLLSVERRTLPTVNETIGLNISNYLTTAYTIDATVDVLPGLTAYLKDNLTGNMTELLQGASTAVNFTVDMNDAQSLDALRFTVVFQPVTLSSDDAVFGSNLSVYPNPVTGDVITINLGDASVDKATVSVYNTLGQQVMTNSYDKVSNGVIKLDNLSDLSNGVYIMNITSGVATTTRRFIKE